MSDTASATRHFAEACRLHQAGELERAEIAYRRVLSEDPMMVDALRNLGALLRKIGKPEEGLKYQERAVRLCPNDTGLLGNLGNVFRDLGRLESSKEAFSKAIRIDNNNTGARLGLAITLNAMKEHGSVIDTNIQFINKKEIRNEDNEYAQLLLEIGNAYHELGDFNSAIKTWGIAQNYAVGEQKLSMVLNSAQVLCSKNKYEDAENILKPFIKTNPESANVIYALAVTMKGQGRWEEACKMFEEALGKEPNYAICLNSYGLLLRDGQNTQS